MTASLPAPPAVAWGRARRIAFRFACLYFVLYALPFPFQHLLQLASGVHGEFFRVEGQMLPAWIAKGFAWIGNNGEYDKFCEKVTTWLSEHHWVPVQVIHQPTGSGDTAHAYAMLAVSLVLAALLTIVWSLVARQQLHHRRLARWLHLGVRWYIGLIVLGYGTIKFYTGQFSYPPLQRLLNPIGDTSPMALVWTFMGVSKPYEVFSGIGETVGSLLLLSRRTSLLGAFVYIPVMTNVVMLNWMYDVPVKLFSTNLLLFGIALLVPDLPRLGAFFLRNRPVPPADLHVTGWRWLRIVLIVFGTAWIGFHLYQAHTGNLQAMKTRAVPRPELYGVWEVEQMTRDGKEVAATDPERWKLLAIDVRDRAWARTITDRHVELTYREDMAAKTVSVVARGTGRPAPPATQPEVAGETWTFERGQEVRKVPDPAPRTMADFGKTVDATRESLVFRGNWQGAPIELRLLRKQFRLQRGFHWVQEMPFNR